MALIENDLFRGTIDKVKMAIERLKQFEPPEGYYLAFSGGKDSIVIKELARMSGVKYESYYNVTTIDPPDLLYYIRAHHKDVNYVRPETPLLKLIVKKGFPIRQARWCCKLYKETGGGGRFVITGVRWAESSRRAGRKMVEFCIRNKTKRFLHVIIDWTDDDVWEFIKLRGLPYCKLYDEGWNRIGCLFCPFAPRKQGEIELDRYPRYKKLFIKAFNELYADRKRRGLAGVDRWDSGEDMFWWWMKKSNKKDDPDQTVLFE